MKKLALTERDAVRTAGVAAHSQWRRGQLAGGFSLLPALPAVDEAAERVRVDLGQALPDYRLEDAVRYRN